MINYNHDKNFGTSEETLTIRIEGLTVFDYQYTMDAIATILKETIYLHRDTETEDIEDGTGV